MKHSISKSILVSALEKIHGGMPAEKIASKLARQLYQQHRPYGPPFLAMDYAIQLNIPVSFSDTIEADGVYTNAAAHRRYTEGEDIDTHSAPEGLYQDDPEKGRRILLRTPRLRERSHTTRRRNFTLAHEIGHHILRHDVREHLTTFSSDDSQEELLCNIFAGELLMPSAIFSSDVRNNGIAPGVLVWLSNRYQVSLQSLLCRLVGIYRGALTVIEWVRDDGRYVVKWASPYRYRRAILCDSGNTPIERAFDSSILETGQCEILLDGKRRRFRAYGERLPSSKIVLGVFFGSSRDLCRVLPVPASTPHAQMQLWSVAGSGSGD